MSLSHSGRRFLFGLALGLAALGSGAPAAEIGEASIADLERAGWTLSRRPDGGLELRTAAPAMERAGSGAPADPAGAPEEVGWERLRASGWRVEETSDGSTLLVPPDRIAGETQEPQAGTATGESAPAATPIGLGVEELQAAGWRVERAADGSLLLYPRPAPEAPRPKPSPHACPGELPSAIAEGRVRLPLQHWEQVRAVAESWLAGVDVGSARIGKIRRIGRVYLVSLVDPRPPFALRHQIAIDGASGRVLVLN